MKLWVRWDGTSQPQHVLMITICSLCYVIAKFLFRSEVRELLHLERTTPRNKTKSNILFISYFGGTIISRSVLVVNGFFRLKSNCCHASVAVKYPVDQPDGQELKINSWTLPCFDFVWPSHELQLTQQVILPTGHPPNRSTQLTLLLPLLLQFLFVSPHGNSGVNDLQRRVQRRTRALRLSRTHKCWHLWPLLTNLAYSYSSKPRSPWCSSSSSSSC